MPMNKDIKPFSAARGVGMIEILITVLVLSVGLLGVAALQGFSLQGSQLSYERTQATNITYELIDHMRAYRSYVESTDSIPDFDEWENRVEALLPGAVLDMCTGSDQSCLADVDGGHYCQQLDSDGLGLRVSVTIDWADEQRLDEDGSEDSRWLFCVTSKI